MWYMKLWYAYKIEIKMNRDKIMGLWNQFFFQPVPDTIWRCVFVRKSTSFLQQNKKLLVSDVVLPVIGELLMVHCIDGSNVCIGEGTTKESIQHRNRDTILFCLISDKIRMCTLHILDRSSCSIILWFPISQISYPMLHLIQCAHRLAPNFNCLSQQRLNALQCISFICKYKKSVASWRDKHSCTQLQATNPIIRTLLQTYRWDTSTCYCIAYIQYGIWQ